MYSARVLTNETCNQNCSFCKVRRTTDRPSVAAPSVVRAAIDAALATGAREIVLTGGEPTLRKDLAAIVAYAKKAGAKEVVLETNGALIDGARAQLLAKAGLDLARVHLPRWGEECDQITRDAGGFGATRAALEALKAAGIRLELAAPVVAGTLAHLVELPEAIAASGLPIRALVLGVPVSGPDEAALVSLPRAAQAIAAVLTAARTSSLALRIDPGGFLPPCLFSQPARVAGLYSLTRGGGERSDHEHLAACEGCNVRDRCPGVPSAALARDPGLEVTPITDDKARRRLSLVSTVEAQIAAELVTRDVRRNLAGETVRENIVRVNFLCNQACRFCFVSTHLPAAELAAIEAAIEEIGRERGVLTLSGGEPTLNARLVDFVKLGKRSGVREVELQTNATRLGNPVLTQSLIDAGVDTFFVSLHGSTAEISDAVTEAPGTFDKTVAGLDELSKHATQVRLNFVFCEKNQTDFPRYVRLVHERWPRAEVSISFVASSTDVVPREKSLIPRYTDVLPHLAQGVRIARELGVVLTGYESMCGVPLCQVPDDLSSYLNLAEIPPGFDRGEFLKAEACRSCAFEKKCFGVRRGYAELHGVSELRPFTGSP